MSKLFRCGYSGGKGGKDFSDDDKIKLSENNIKINQIGVKSDKFVDSICITYSLNNEESVTSERHGDIKGDLDIFNLDENEYVTKVSGRFGSMIDSLEIVTNLGSKKRYGGKGGFADFEYEAPNNYQIIGFFGRAGWHIDAIGVIFKSLDDTNV